MRKLSLMIVIALVLGLLVMVSTPASAGKPNPPAEKNKNVSKGQPAENKPDKTTPPGQAKPDKPGKAGAVVAPADPMEPGENAGRMVVICHKPGTPAEQTLTLPESAVAGHLGHGDLRGACPGPANPPTSTLPITPTSPITPSLVPTSTQRISICHKPGTPAEKTLWLPASAIPGHLGHGDELGACLGATAPPTSTLPVTNTVPVTTVVAPTDTVRILICHKPGTAAEQTLALPAAEVPEHLAHLDTLGACEGAPSLTWATELIVALTRWLMYLFV